jgi:phage gpG-like protein
VVSLFNLVLDSQQLESFLIKKTNNVDIKNLYKIALPILKSEVSKSFKNERRSSDGVDWKKSKIALRKKRKTLHDTGTLEEGMQDNSNYIIQGNEIKELSSTEYGAKHNFGYDINDPNDLTSFGLEYRQFAGISKDGIQELIKTFEVAL